MAPPINWALWKLYKETIEGFLKEGYEPIGVKDGGKGSAVLAAQRTLVDLGHIPQGASDGGKLANWVKTQERRKESEDRHYLPDWSLFDQWKAAHGLSGFKPVLDGFVIKSTSVELDEDGEVKRTFVKQVPEHKEQFSVPDGHAVKGVSALVDGDGRTIARWIKTKEGQIDPIALAVEIKSHFETWKPSYIPEAPSEVGQEGRLAFLPISDLHVGLVAWWREAGENWDLQIARKTILETYAELIEQTPQTDEAFILFGGDQQHADNFDGVTERSKHRLDVDGRYPKIHLTLCEIAVEIIMMMRKRHRKIGVRVLQGNHDRHSAIALAHFLYAWFRDDKAVEVDLSPSLFWFKLFGNTLLCGVHGHTIKARDLPGKVAAIQPELWGKSVWRVCHYFHEHHDETIQKDASGLKVEKHAIIAPPDAFHAGGPHSAFRNAKSIVYSLDGGERSRTVVNIAPARS